MDYMCILIVQLFHNNITLCTDKKKNIYVIIIT